MKRVKVAFWGIDSILEFVKITGSSRHKMELVIHEDCCEHLLERLDPYIEHGSLLDRAHHLSA